MKIAVIDTGTNSTRLLVADITGKGITELERLTTVTRLGEGVDSGNHLHASARKRVVDCVNDYASRIEGFDVKRSIVLATSSVRDAGDGEEFLASLAESHGFDWRLLSGDEEARLSFSGAVLESSEVESAALFDVGGGSTEIVTGIGGRVKYARSLNVGCVRLTERFITRDPVSREELDQAAAFIEAKLDHEVVPDIAADCQKTIAVAGTATTLAAIDLGLERFDRDAIHGHVISQARISELLAELGKMTLEQKLEVPVIQEGRADVIVAGTLILERLMLHAGAEALAVSELDILDGAVQAAALKEI